MSDFFFESFKGEMEIRKRQKAKGSKKHFLISLPLRLFLALIFFPLGVKENISH